MGYEFFVEKIIFPSTPVLGINNDQSLISFRTTFNVSSTNNGNLKVACPTT